MSWVNCYIGTEAAKDAARSWFGIVVKKDAELIRAAIHETEEGRETELRAVFVVSGVETEYRRRRQAGGHFTISIRKPTPWPVK